MANHQQFCSMEGGVIAEATYKQIGTSGVQEFRIANNRSYKKNDEWKEETTYMTVKFWTKKPQDLAKGAHVIVTGILKEESWEKEGQKHSKIVLNADRVHLLVSVPKASGSAPSSDETPF